MKRDRAADAARRARARKIIIAVLIAVAIGAATYAGIAASRRRAANIPGESYPGQGQDHVPLDREFSYNSNPPSSGPHFSSPANWGIYDYEVNDKLFVHNLEHGGIWISYRPALAPNVIEDLKNIINEFGGSKIVMAPRSANDADISVAAWTRVLKFNLIGGILSEDQKNQIRAFYRALKNRGPEFVPDSMPGVNPKSVQ